MQTSILFLLIVLFGGLGRVTGPLVGSMVLIVLPELLHRFSDYRLVMYGVLLLGSIYFLPQGVVGRSLLGGDLEHPMIVVLRGDPSSPLRLPFLRDPRPRFRHPCPAILQRRPLSRKVSR